MLTYSDECHRAVTPQTKRDIERFFTQSIWFGFTGTPIFEQNKYEQKGDLAQTTEEIIWLLLTQLYHKRSYSRWGSTWF